MMSIESEVTKIPMPDGDMLEYVKFTNPINGHSLGEVWRRLSNNGLLMAEDYSTSAKKRHLYRNGQLEFTYDPSKHGCINAIRIYTDGCINAIRIYTDARGHSFAQLAFANMDVEPIIIDWTSCEKDVFAIGISGYTKIFDERFPNRTFESFLKNKEV